MTTNQLSPEAEKLLDDLRRAKLAEVAAMRRYLTAMEQKTIHLQQDNQIRGSRPA